MPFQIVHQDITKMNTDAIVNAANSGLHMGGGVCGAIFKAAGPIKLQAACYKCGRCPEGGAVITPGFKLPAKYVIHAVGPVWKGGKKGEREALASAYESSLKLAVQYKLNSISFPLISSGIYGYPKAEALQVAAEVFQEFLKDHEMDIYLAVFDRKAVELSESLFHGIAHYIDTYFVEESGRRLTAEGVSSVLPQEKTSASTVGLWQSQAPFEAVPTDGSESETGAGYLNNLPQEKVFLAEECREMEGEAHRLPDPVTAAPVFKAAKKPAPDNSAPRSLKDVLGNLEETFTEMLLRLIDEKGKNDVEVYKRANIDRKLFSKIRGNIHYNPKKSTAIALAIGLELSLDETIDLMAKAGYALSRSSKFDVIIRYFIEHENYNLFEINEALFYFEQPLLGV